MIEDDITIADLMRVVVEDGGYECVSCHAPHALPPGPFDVVITDLLDTLAYSRGAAERWLERLAEAYPDAPVVIVTGHAGILADRDGLRAARVIMKPFEIDQLIEAIRAVAPG